MTTYVGGAVGVTTVALPAHQVGDLITMWAFRDGNNAAPGPVLSGWTTWSASSGANTCGDVLAYLRAGSTGHVSGVWSNGTSIIALVHRPDSGYLLHQGTFVRAGGSGTLISFPALTFANTVGRSWAAAFAGHRSVANSVGTVPTSMTSRVGSADATDASFAFDSNGTLTTWSVSSTNVAGTGAGWRTLVAEIAEVARPAYTLADSVVVDGLALTSNRTVVARTNNALIMVDDAQDTLWATRLAESNAALADNSAVVLLLSRLLLSVTNVIDGLSSSVEQGATGQLYSNVLTSLLDLRDDIASRDLSLTRVLSSTQLLLDELVTQIQSGGGALLNSTLSDALTMASLAVTLSAYTRLFSESVVVDEPGVQRQYDVLAESLSDVTDLLVNSSALRRVAESLLVVVDELSSQLTAGFTLYQNTLTSAVVVASQALKALQLLREEAVVADDGLVRTALFSRSATSTLALLDELVTTLTGAGLLVNKTLTSAMEMVDELVKSLSLVRYSDDGVLLVDSLSGPLALGRFLSDDVAAFDALLKASRLTATLESAAQLDDTTLRVFLLARVLASVAEVADSLASSVTQFFLSYAVRGARLALAANPVRLSMRVPVTLGVKQNPVRVSMGAMQ